MENENKKLGRRPVPEVETIRFQHEMPTELAAWFDVEAANMGVSRRGLVNVLLSQYREQKDKERAAEPVLPDYSKLYESGHFWKIETPANRASGGELEFSVDAAIQYLKNEVNLERISRDFYGVTVTSPSMKVWEERAVQRFIDLEGRV
jgi:hypothetical protein